LRQDAFDVEEEVADEHKKQADQCDDVSGKRVVAD
jgi:hypothetical protein